MYFIVKLHFNLILYSVFSKLQSVFFSNFVVNVRLYLCNIVLFLLFQCLAIFVKSPFFSAGNMTHKELQLYFMALQALSQNITNL